MAVLVLEARDCCRPLFLVRMWALLCGCLTFSLVASLQQEQLSSDNQHPNTFWITCMTTWCSFFTLTFLINLLNVLQFHSLLPVSWKNLTMTTAALGALMTLSASVLFPWMVLRHPLAWARPLAATVASCFTAVAYCCEMWVIRGQTQEQWGYMASLPGFLKILQCWGGFQMVPLFLERMADRDGIAAEHHWQLWLSVGLYNVCLLMSLASIAVILCDCTARCPFPYDRLLAGISLLGVVFYMVATVLCVANVLQQVNTATREQLVMECVVASTALLGYTVDFSFCIKQLCERGHG